MNSRVLITLLIFHFSFSFFAGAQSDDSDPAQILKMVEQLKIQNQDRIDAAMAAMDAVKKAGAYIESISDLFSDGIVTLPVGIKKGDYELIIQKITQDKKTGKSIIHASCAFKLKEDGQTVAFEGNTILEGQKGLGTSGFLKLISPVRRNIGEQGAIVFNAGTKVNFGCEGIESFFAKINLIVTSSQIIAVDNSGKATGKQLSTSIESTFYDFDNYTVSFSFNQSFKLNGLKDVIFKLQGATLDQSDIETSPLVQFPENYFTSTNVDEKKLWKGIAFSNASIELPAIFKKQNSTSDNPIQSPVASNRITLAFKKVVIDENGFSGNVEAKGIYSSDIIDKSKWDITVTDFALNVLKNNLSDMRFSGDINLPPLGKSSLLPYSANYNHSTQDYEFKVGVSGNYEFPMLRSTLKLDETSFVNVLFKDSDIYPTLNASGKITVNAPMSSQDSTKKFSVPDIPFQEMLISRESPYFSVGKIGITGDLASPKVAGFELTITDIQAFKDSSVSGLSFNAGVKLNEMFGGSAGLKLYGDYANWKFDRVGLDQVNVNFQSKAYSVIGGVQFKNGDALYGTGFRGSIKLTLIDKFTFDAVGVFGKKEDYRYFLTDVFFETSPTNGITVPPALSFYGVGGGMYRHMQQTSETSGATDFGKSLSNINYVPDKTVGMGFMAATKFGLLGAPQGFNAKVGFEMQFNNDGGVNFIQLRGDASIMDSPEKWGKLADNINSQTQKLAQAGGVVKLAMKSDLAVPENMNSGFLTASMNIKYDLANSVFSADLKSYLNAGFITGVGENNCLGWASAYFSKDKWYTYLGTPSNPLGAQILGLAKSKGYFMIGDDIPALPPPPQKVLQNFSLEKQDKLNNRSISALTSGSGIAFGQSLEVDFKATLRPFYASLGIGLGAEFLLKNYGLNAYCLGGNPPLGFNGWYAQAQAWAWVEAGIGIETKLFNRDYRLSILDLSASALLAGAGPNPFYFTGAVGGRFNVMGGLISGQCDFDFEIGKQCKVAGGSPFGVEVIAQLTPAEGDKDINVFASPQAVFNIPIGLEMKVEEEPGTFIWYKVALESFVVKYKANGQVVDGLNKKSEDAKVYLLDPTEPFESKKEMIAYAKVSFSRSFDGKSWSKVNGSDGKPLYEEKTTAFTSGERPNEILPEHVKYSYPVARQYNYYPNEYRQGYLKVTENYSYLFTTEKPEGYDQKLRLTDTDGKQQATSFTSQTFAAGNDIRFEINFSTQGFNFANDEIYKLTIVNVPQITNIGITSNITTNTANLADNNSVQVSTQSAEGTLVSLDEKEIYGLHFRTSAHKTFADKMASITNYEGVVNQQYPHVYTLISNAFDPITPTEIFDYSECNNIATEVSLITIKPLYATTTWFKEKVNPLMYGNKDLLEATNLTQLTPPNEKQVISFSSLTPNNKLTDDMIASNARPSLFYLGAYHYSASYYIDRDFNKLRSILSSKRITSGNASAGTAKILNADNIPDLSNGTYEMQFEYTLPGTNIITSSIKKTIKLTNFLD